MGGLIPQWFIDDLLNRVDIVGVIDSRVPLKKAGHEYKACCPFHNEKTPSFTVSPAKQFYHCFGCGVHGTAFTFLMEYEHLDFIEAVELLAAQQGMDIPRGQGQQPQQDHPSSELYELLQQVMSYYCQQLKQSPTTADYLKRRGLDGKIAAEYSLGYAPPGWDNLIRVFGSDKHEALLKSGMLTTNDKGHTYDRFRERIMFPIRDRRGRVIGFGGRIIDKVEGAKYLNSPETPVFRKGRELYGLYEARKAVNKLQNLYIVEGYMDVIALAQNNIRNVVATLGTATTPDHLKQLFKIVPQIVFCFDGDRAGRDAAWRALENALPIMRDGYIIRFLFLPDGEDPDSMIRQHGKIKFEQMANKAKTLSQYFYEQLSIDIDLETHDGKSRLARLANPLLKKMPGGIFYELMLNELARLTGIAPDRLTTLHELEKELPVVRRNNADQTQSRRSPIRFLLSLLVQHPEIAQTAVELPDIRRLPVKGADLLAEILRFLQVQPGAHTATLLEHWRNTEYGPHLLKLASAELFLEKANLGHLIESEFSAGIQRLLKEFSPDNPRQIAAKMARGEPLSDDEKAIMRQSATTETSARSSG